ncbi:replication protein a 14 kda subunit [Plakobranchus ocellatus]|uniref:Replication protein a 14 kDa subunit n=1 Tax=Plakobranchus ocellatus TaxID=259542 RepID=A0AAV3YMR5_9GAST|nr:replication protein a 14 kda subunit [Plakobranchus ocellatus]
MSGDEHTKPRVNASLLPNYLGRQVCLLGLAKNVDSSGTFFTLTTSDNQDVRVQMQEPLSMHVAGLTEVQGQVASRNSVQCDNVVVFSDEATESFDMALYQRALELTQRCSDHYIQGGIMED